MSERPAAESDVSGENRFINNINIEKHVRYDRGIRIWGHHGQAALEDARVCLLHCSATGSEALKNVVLGGINSFVIVDDYIIEEEDLGNNFMVTSTSIGKSRAQVVTECLKELNEHVSGSFVEESPKSLLTRKPEFFKDFDIVIGTQFDETMCRDLDAVCRNYDVYLVIVRSYGLFGSLRNCTNEVCVIESKPEHSLDDLRLGDPWPELLEAARSIDLDALDPTAHSHVPYGLLLVKAADVFKQRHGGSLPSTPQMREEFKNIIRSWMRSVDGCPIPEENFEEALSNVSKVWGPRKLPPEIECIMDDLKLHEIEKNFSPFWVVVAAIKRFMLSEGQGHLPLNPTLPDMHSTTSNYLHLQHLYKARSESDIFSVSKHVNAIASELGLEEHAISSHEIRRICIHSRMLRVVRTKAFSEIPASTVWNSIKTLSNCDGTSAAASIYCSLLAVDAFHHQHKRFPGTEEADIEDDLALLKITMSSILENAPSGISVNEDYLNEVVRFGGGELHSVSSVMGAMASQEVIKLLTGQYVPLGGTLIFDGINTTTTVIEFK